MINTDTLLYSLTSLIFRQIHWVITYGIILSKSNNIFFPNTALHIISILCLMMMFIKQACTTFINKTQIFINLSHKQYNRQPCSTSSKTWISFSFMCRFTTQAPYTSPLSDQSAFLLYHCIFYNPFANSSRYQNRNARSITMQTYSVIHSYLHVRRHSHNTMDWNVIWSYVSCKTNCNVHFLIVIITFIHAQNWHAYEKVQTKMVLLFREEA